MNAKFSVSCDETGATPPRCVQNLSAPSDGAGSAPPRGVVSAVQDEAALGCDGDELAQLDRRIRQLERRQNLEQVVVNLRSDPGTLRRLRQLRARVSALQGARRGKKRSRLAARGLHVVSPELAKFWASMPFADFIQEFAHSVRSGELSFDRSAWQELFQDVWSPKRVDVEALRKSARRNTVVFLSCYSMLQFGVYIELGLNCLACELDCIDRPVSWPRRPGKR